MRGVVNLYLIPRLKKGASPFSGKNVKKTHEGSSIFIAFQDRKNMSLDPRGMTCSCHIWWTTGCHKTLCFLFLSRTIEHMVRTSKQKNWLIALLCFILFLSLQLYIYARLQFLNKCYSRCFLESSHK